MTQPQMPNDPRGTMEGQQAAAHGVVAATPKPKMTDEELRLQCITLAVQARALPAALVSTAQSILSFVKSGS